MKRMLFVLALVAAGPVAWADGPPPAPQCSLAAGLLVTQDEGTVTLACTGITPEFGEQLAALITQVLQRRLDPQAVVAKLVEIEPVPAVGVARMLDLHQRQAVIQSLVGKAPQEIAIAADPAVSDAAEYGTSIAAPLAMVGWQITGNHITRKADPALAAVNGVALVVHDPAAAPEKAKQLRDALSAARVVAPIVADPRLAAGETVLWIGKRPQFPVPPKS